MSYVLNKLSTKKDVDNAIKSCEDKVLVLRFGRDADTVCQQLDDIVREYDPLSILDDHTAIIVYFVVITIFASSKRIEAKSKFN